MELVTHSDADLLFISVPLRVFYLIVLSCGLFYAHT